MMQAQLQQMLKKMKHLPPHRLAEVEDFIDFIQQRDPDKYLRQEHARGVETVFAKVWDNDEDAVYDKL